MKKTFAEISSCLHLISKYLNRKSNEPNLPGAGFKSMFPTKVPITKHLQSDVVYAVICKDCRVNYIGKTERQCGRRLHQHGARTNTFDKHLDTTNKR